MFHHIGKIVLEVGAAIIGYVVVDKTAKEITGKHIHEHVFEWWCKLREDVTKWLHSHQNLGIQRIGLKRLSEIDDLIVVWKRAADKITIKVFGQDARLNSHEITTREISIEEALATFPELRNGDVLLDKTLFLERLSTVS
jgi:hypothetical protein